MTALLIILGILLLIGILPLGVSLRYDEAGAQVYLCAGPVKIRIVPGKKENKQKEIEPSKEKPAPKANASGQKTEKSPKKSEKGGSLLDFLPLVDLLLDFLGDFRRKLRVNLLRMHVVLAGDDPCDTAVNYGRIQAAGAGLLAQLDRFLVIKKQDVWVACDFAADSSVITACLDITVTIGRLLGIVCVYGVKGLITYLKINKKRKGGAAL